MWFSGREFGRSHTQPELSSAAHTGVKAGAGEIEVGVFQLLLLLFLVVPIVEIYVLIQVGGSIGAGPTVALVVLTAVAGAALVRAQGFRAWVRVQQAMNAGEIPAVEMLEGLLILIAGVLLLTPGFVTDGLGFLLLIPPLRRPLIRGALARGMMRVRGTRPASRGSAKGRPDARRGGRVIEGEFKRKGGGPPGPE